MPSFHSARKLSPRVAGVVAILLAETVTHSAEASPDLRVAVVCTKGASCAAFTQRLRGQTSDLKVEIQDALQSLPTLPLAASIAAVDEIAKATGSTVAVWWSQGSLAVLLREPAPGRVMVRRVAADAFAIGSAELEAGSLIARTAIIAALEGKPIGEPRPTPPPPPLPLPTPWELSLGLGASLHWDEVPPSRGEGLEFRAGIRRGRLRFGGQWTQRRDEDLDLPYARGTLAGRLLFGFVGFELLALPAFALGVEGRVGKLRSTVQSSTGAYRDPVEFSRTILGVGVRYHHVLLPNRLLLWAALNLDHVQDPIVIGVRDAAGFHPVWPMAANQPSVGLGIEYFLPIRL